MSCGPTFIELDPPRCGYVPDIDGGYVTDDDEIIWPGRCRRLARFTLLEHGVPFYACGKHTRWAKATHPEWIDQLRRGAVTVGIWTVIGIVLLILLVLIIARAL